MAAPEAKYAPIGALRGGVALLVIGALLTWGPVDSVPAWVGVTTMLVGGLLLALALGIRMLQE
jgi:hypothetical protein